MKYTPGPWYMNMYYHENETRHFGIFVDGKQIAHLAERTNQQPDWATEQEQNARLIAAAPELLEACKYAFENLKPQGSVKKDFSGHNAMATLSRAIARAEGKD